MPHSDDSFKGHRAAPWEKIVLVVLAGLILGFLAYLLIRNTPFSDPNLVVIMRTMLSLAVAAMGALIPGFLKVGWQRRGLAIRAGGALALFVLTYFFTPKVIPAVAGDHAPYASVSIVVPDGSEIADSDPPGALMVDDPAQSNRVLDFLHARLDDQAIFAVRINIPDEVKLRHSSDYDHGLDESERAAVDQGFAEEIALQMTPWSSAREGGADHEVRDLSAMYAIMVGPKAVFANGFNRERYDRYAGRTTYQGFFQVYHDAVFAGYHFLKFQSVQPDPAKAAATYEKFESERAEYF